MKTAITHQSDRLVRLIADGRLDGQPGWTEQFEGNRKEAEDHVRWCYGRAGRVERTEQATTFRYVGFKITVSES